MKKILFVFVTLFLFSVNVLADDCAKKSNVDKKVSADYYCYYNKTGLKSDDDNYNVIVGISSNHKKAYADIGRCDNTIGGAGTEPIKNWKHGDSDWDGDLGESFSAMNYFSKNKKCPEVAYIHYYPIEHNLYLVDREQITSLLSTFSYKAAQDNEEKYYLVDFVEEPKTKMSCSYDVEMKENTAATQDNYDVKFKLNFSDNGKIINANNIQERVTLSTEVGSSYEYVGETCPQLYICPVIGKTYSMHGISVSEYRFELYFADFKTNDKRNNCKVIFCTNTNDLYCDKENSETYICPIYKDLILELENGFNEYKNDVRNHEKIEKYNEAKLKIKNYCKSAMSNYDVDNPCLKSCLGLENEIYEKYTLEKNINQGKCGFSARLLVWVSNILRWIKYILPVAVIILSILDFIRAIGTDKDDEMKKAQKKFITRLIAAALVFIIPLIIEFVLDKMGFGYNDCGIIN